MDTFDDLLAPSRQALEQNPFEDPFAKRSNSPDPWASVYQQPNAQYGDIGGGFDDGSGGGFGDHSHDAFGGPSTTHTDTPVDPLDSANATAEPEDEPQTPSISSPISSAARSPGFRESISTTVEESTSSFEQTAHTPPRNASPTPTPAVPPAPLVPSPPSQSTPLPETQPDPVPERRQSVASHLESTSSPFSTSHSPHVSSAFTASTFVSPLDQPSRSSPFDYTQSFAGLSIGGESAGGWGGSQNTSIAPIVSREPSTATDGEVPLDDDDDDDDKPILQTRSLQQAVAASESKALAQTKEPNGIQPVFVITVDDPQRVGDPIRAYIMYTVHTKTTSPMYSKSAFSVLRRYSDFLWLYETLSNNNPGVVVAPVPGKSAFGRFDSQFVEQRRAALEICIRKIVSHPVLQKDTDLKLFLESDSFALDIKHRKAEIAHEKGGLMAAIGQTIAGPRFYETDEWFDKQKGYLDSLELQLKGLVKTIDIVSKQRADVMMAIGEFAQAVQELSQADVSKSLTLALAGLAEVERKAEEVQRTQAHEDVSTLLSVADEYSRLINSVRLAFSSRVRMYHAWQTADANVKRVKQTHEANRAQGKLSPDQLGRSLSVVAESERRALDAKQEFEQTSRLVKMEVARFEKERIEDFKDALELFLDGMIKRQKELITAWENYQQTLLRRAQPPQPQPSVEVHVNGESSIVS